MKPHSGKARPFDSWDALKLIALLLMFTDHTGHFFLPGTLWLRAIGRGTMPIFLFLAGYAASYRFKWDLFALAALLSLSDFLLTGHIRMQNILVTILLCRMIFAWLERRGKIIKRPWEWYIASLALVISIFIVQYGSFGFLFALSGYVKRHSKHYPPALPGRFLGLSFIAYASYTQLWTVFSVPNLLLMLVTLYSIYLLLKRFDVHQPRWRSIPPWALHAGKFLSYYSGYIYALHLIALEWITGIPF